MGAAAAAGSNGSAQKEPQPVASCLAARHPDAVSRYYDHCDDEEEEEDEDGRHRAEDAEDAEGEEDKAEEEDEEASPLSVVACSLGSMSGRSFANRRRLSEICSSEIWLLVFCFSRNRSRCFFHYELSSSTRYAPGVTNPPCRIYHLHRLRDAA